MSICASSSRFIPIPWHGALLAMIVTMSVTFVISEYMLLCAHTPELCRQAPILRPCGDNASPFSDFRMWSYNPSRMTEGILACGGFAGRSWCLTISAARRPSSSTLSMSSAILVSLRLSLMQKELRNGGLLCHEPLAGRAMEV